MALSDKFITISLIATCAFIALFAILMIILDYNTTTRYMQQCLDDGRKEYECNVIIHGNNGIILTQPIRPTQ